MPRGRKANTETNTNTTTQKKSMISVDNETSLIIGTVQDKMVPLFGFRPTKSQVIRHAFAKLDVDVDEDSRQSV